MISSCLLQSHLQGLCGWFWFQDSSRPPHGAMCKLASSRWEHQENDFWGSIYSRLRTRVSQADWPTFSCNSNGYWSSWPQIHRHGCALVRYRSNPSLGLYSLVPSAPLYSLDHLSDSLYLSWIARKDLIWLIQRLLHMSKAWDNLMWCHLLPWSCCIL